jgi:hypothetical protein
MSTRTIFLAKLIGPFFILVALSILLQRQLVAETITGMMHDLPLLFIVALITITCGLAIVILHNHWTGGALPVVVTIIGWIILLKGVILLLVPPQVQLSIMETFRVEQLLYLYGAIDLLIGIYLTVAGFLASPRTA